MFPLGRVATQLAGCQPGSIELLRELKQRLVTVLFDFADYFSGALLDERVKEAGCSDDLVQFVRDAGIRISDLIHRAGR